jgi:hypothetical protein
MSDQKLNIAFKKLLPASVAEGVVTHPSCPVMVVRKPKLNRALNELDQG